MKILNVVFEDKEHEFLVNLKKEMGWRKFILKLAEKDKNEQ